MTLHDRTMRFNVQYDRGSMLLRWVPSTSSLFFFFLFSLSLKQEFSLPAFSFLYGDTSRCPTRAFRLYRWYSTAYQLIRAGPDERTEQGERLQKLPLEWLQTHEAAVYPLTVRVFSACLAFLASTPFSFNFTCLIQFWCAHTFIVCSSLLSHSILIVDFTASLFPQFL